MNTNINQIEDFDAIENFLIDLRAKTLRIQGQTDLKNLAIIKKLERRSENILNAIGTIQSERAYLQYGFCSVCGTQCKPLDICPLHGKIEAVI